jgi:hypothetical protein
MRGPRRQLATLRSGACCWVDSTSDISGCHCCKLLRMNQSNTPGVFRHAVARPAPHARGRSPSVSGAELGAGANKLAGIILATVQAHRLATKMKTTARKRRASVAADVLLKERGMSPDARVAALDPRVGARELQPNRVVLEARLLDVRIPGARACEPHWVLACSKFTPVRMRKRRAPVGGGG